MTSHSAILCVTLGKVPSPASLAQAVAGYSLHQVASLKEAERLQVLQPVRVGLLLIGTEFSEPPAALEEFLLRHWQVRWVALLPPRLLCQPCWRALVHAHCHDFHTMPLDAARLGQTLGHVQGLAALGTALLPATAPVLPHMVGISNAMTRMRGQLQRVAGVLAPVLISGESGSGKELVAQAVHGLSARRKAPFIAVNCAALPASLIHAELFGHERGAYTGASRERRGLIEAAQGGTLLLDEIGDLPLELQASLLRFLQEKTILRLGSTVSRTVDVRVLAATHVDLAQAVARGSFREDLYYRLNVLSLEVPPLRQRREDVLPLAQYFFQQYAGERSRQLRGFSRTAAQALAAHDWPGNVRELLNRVRRAMVMADGRWIMPPDLGLEAVARSRAELGLDDARVLAERAAIAASLLEAGSNVAQAARRLGVSRMTLYRLLAKHGIAVRSHQRDTLRSAPD
ncbi:sigma-54 dependent transcriptional regulator [Duganella qianjiadongensis]|uniref:Helix-turn-helix domain-containing protein n=1 Tax=Duganella qianjiadongensis TaxID=2692176 RepID=A0ABW9VDT8_9BURK|nr:sigma-54 dependent transcriptional regulator [Duganella qianjiadongensis]MYM37799.1 helix-turn-helix domain-containing protein [Duganella qianjiadongensis]